MACVDATTPTTSASTLSKIIQDYCLAIFSVSGYFTSLIHHCLVATDISLSMAPENKASKGSTEYTNLFMVSVIPRLLKAD